MVANKIINDKDNFFEQCICAALLSFYYLLV